MNTQINDYDRSNSYYSGLGYPSPMAWADGCVTAKITRQLSGVVPNNGYCSKSFRWTKKTKRVVRSKAVALAYEAIKVNKDAVWFVTLTSQQPIYENKTIGRFIENMKKQGVIKTYLWVRERHKSGTNHWHLLFTSSQKWMHYPTVQKAWNSALRTGGYAVNYNCSVRWGNRPRVWNIQKVSNYICKYMSKSENAETPDDIRITHSSRVTYKAPIDLDYCLQSRLKAKVSYCMEYVVSHYFEANDAYIRWVREGWARNEYLSQLYN